VKIRSISAPQEEGARAALFRFTVVNVGGTPANITGHTFQVIFHTGQEGVVLSLQDPDIVTEDVWLVSGDRHTFEHRTEWIDPGPDNSVIVTGEVTYTDGAEISRHTGFARVYDPNRGGYSVSEIYTEDEYED
jgi:hypothetical protein